MENGINIKNNKITDLSIHFPKNNVGRVKLEAKCSVNLKNSKDKNDHSKLLVMKINVSSKNKEINIEMESETIFECNEPIEDMDKFMKKILVPEVSDQLFIILDDILEKMGYPKMNFAREK